MEQNVVAFSKAKTKKRSTDLFVRELTPCPRDIDAYWKIAFGENLHRFVSFLEARSPSEAERRITEAFKNRYETMYGLFKKNRLIGVFSVNDGAINGQKIAEMHYFIAEKFQRRGYCTEGIRLLSVMLSDTYDFFIFSIRNENISSKYVQEKLGSVKVGGTKNYTYYKLQIVS